MIFDGRVKLGVLVALFAQQTPSKKLTAVPPGDVAADAQRAKKAPGVPKAQDSLAGDTNLRMGWPSWRHSETVSKMIFTEAEAN